VIGIPFQALGFVVAIEEVDFLLGGKVERSQGHQLYQKRGMNVASFENDAGANSKWDRKRTRQLLTASGGM